MKRIVDTIGYSVLGFGMNFFVISLAAQHARQEGLGLFNIVILTMGVLGCVSSAVMIYLKLKRKEKEKNNINKS